jgi:tRNA-dihydrouridine synthase B
MEKKSDLQIYFAPLQEATDFVYRKVYASIFGQTDKYFSPYILRQNDGSIKKSHLRDILPENCPDYLLIPQIMAGTSIDFLFLARRLCDLGYTEINWNLGCPYPMVTNKGLGSGLLPYPEKIRLILEETLPLLPCRISVKMRSGLNSPDEITSVIPVLNDFPISEIILHPRIAKQLYRDSADRELFSKVSGLFKHPIAYNGDIENCEDFNNCRAAFVHVNSWMIGRGILKDPFLPSKIKGLSLPDKNEKGETLSRFHHEILFQYSKLLSGSSHLLMRMNKFWSYFCFAFPQPSKAFKRVKKATNMAKYDIAVRDNFQSLRNEEN